MKNPNEWKFMCFFNVINKNNNVIAFHSSQMLYNLILKLKWVCDPLFDRFFMHIVQMSFCTSCEWSTN